MICREQHIIPAWAKTDLTHLTREDLAARVAILRRNLRKVRSMFTTTRRTAESAERQLTKVRARLKKLVAYQTQLADIVDRIEALEQEQ